ncbi:hypothetical protein RBB50_008856 [Rhinocladiella similis]
MSLRIVLSGNERGFFHPGDCVKGVVRLNVPREGRAESISLSFFGRSLVIIPQGGGDNSRSCGYLFRQQIILQQGLQFHANQTFYWPFAFQLPRHASFLYPDEINAANIDGVFCNNPPWRGSSEAETIALPSSNLYEGKFNCQVDSASTAECRRFRLVEATCEIPVRERDPLEDQYYAGLNTELDHEDEYLQFVTERGLEVTYLEKHATVSTPSGSHLVPEFVTYNIFRAYSLVVVCEMDYGDERFTFTKKGIPVQLFNCEPHEHAIELDRGVNVRQSRVGSVEAAHELDVLHTTPDVVGLSEITAMEPPPSYTASIS